MISALEKIDSVLLHQVYDAMLMSQTSGPRSRGEIFQPPRFTDTAERLSHYCFRKV